MKVCLWCFLFFLIWPATQITAQDSVIVEPVDIKYIDGIADRAQRLDEKLDKSTTKLLQHWRKQEDKINRRLAKKDSSKAASLLANYKQQFALLEQKLQSNDPLHQYIPSLDTLNTSLQFLQRNPQFIVGVKDVNQKLSGALSNIKEMESHFQKAEDVKNFLKQRRQYLKDQLSQLGFAKALKQLNKRAYYYSAQINEYKSLLRDRRKAERKALELLANTKIYRDFMRKHSRLALLFPLPGISDDPLTVANLVGLQTTAQVQQVIQQQVAASGPNGQQLLQQNIQAAQSELNQLKEKLIKLPSTGGDFGQPEFAENFKPNQQKTKSLLDRLELGTNVQSQKSNGFFPTTSDIGLSLGYKLNDKSIIGVGGSYKMGWGKDVRHINITNQGVGLRTSVDWKIKGSFWLTGGYEMNYRSEFNNIEQLRALNAWQQSGLVGVSKLISLKTKFFKKTKLQLMWDFLSYQQVPTTQPLVFRVGYTF